MKHTSFFYRLIFFFPCIIIFLGGYLYFLLTGRTWNIAYKSMRFLFHITDGRLNSYIAKIMSIKRPPKQVRNDVDSVLGHFSSKRIDDIVLKIKEDGYFIFDEKLAPEFLSKIFNFATETPTQKMVGLGKYEPKEVKVNPNIAPESPRYQYQNERLLRSDELNTVICDNLFLTISERYLNCRPFFDYFVMWWSFPYGTKLANAAAQQYHYDLDRFRFLKFFFYVSDVTTETGPHCFIRGSHSSRVDKLRIDGRIDDNDINAHYKKEDILEIEGVKGTVIAVDTMGLHKGKPLEKDHRLLFQILYSNSLFGPQISKIDIPNSISLKNKQFLEVNRDVFDSSLVY